MQPRTRILVIDSLKNKVREHFLLPADLVDEFQQIAIILSNGDPAITRKMNRNGIDVLKELPNGDLMLGRRLRMNSPRYYENDMVENENIHQGNAVIIGGYDDETETIISTDLPVDHVRVNYVSEDIIDLHTRCLN